MQVKNCVYCGWSYHRLVCRISQMWPILVVFARLKIQLCLAKSFVPQLVDTSKTKRCQWKLRVQIPPASTIELSTKKKKNNYLCFLMMKTWIKSLAKLLTLLSLISFAAKQWKRMITKATFVGPAFTRKPPKYERFIRPSGLRFTKAHVTHPELKCTFNLDIIGVKKNPNGQMYTSLGVMTRGTIIEVQFSCKC